MAIKLQTPRACGHGRSGAGTGGAGALYSRWAGGEHGPVNRGTREGGTLQRHGDLVDGSTLCVRQPSLGIKLATSALRTNST